MIKLKRRDCVADKGCPYNVYLNDKKICQIKNGEELGMDLKPGDYVMQIKGGNFISEKLKFTIYGEQLTSIICYPLYSENKGTKFFYKALCNKVGIELKIEDNFYL